MNVRCLIGGLVFACALLVSALEGCSAGGGAMPAPVRSSGGNLQSNQAEATLRIVIPERMTASGRRRPAYISPYTTSLAWSVDNEPEPLIPLTVTGNSECSGAGASTTCNIPFYVSPGTHTFEFTLEDAKGVALSTATMMNVSVPAGVSTSVKVTLGGIPRAITITSPNGNLTSETAAPYTQTLYGNAPVSLTIDSVDSDGNTIVGDGAPTVSVTLVPASSEPSSAPSTVPAALVTPGSGADSFTLTSSYAPSDPTVAYDGYISVSASPIPGDDIKSIAYKFPLVLYVPKIFLTQAGSASVTSYDEEGTAENTAISGLGAPAAIAFGKNVSAGTGYLYIGKVSTPKPAPSSSSAPTPSPTPSFVPSGSEVAYQIDGNAASVSFASPGVPVGLAYDTNTNVLDVLNSIGTALVTYPSGGGSPTTLVTSIAGPSSIAYDSTDRDIYVSSSSGVAAYTENGSLDSSVSAFAGLGKPSAIAYDSHDNVLLVADESANTVYAYTPSGGMSTGRFAVVPTPSAMLYDPYVQLVYVTNGSSIAAYDGRVTSKSFGALQSLSGSFTGISKATSLTVVL